MNNTGTNLVTSPHPLSPLSPPLHPLSPLSSRRTIIGTPSSFCLSVSWVIESKGPRRRMLIGSCFTIRSAVLQRTRVCVSLEINSRCLSARPVVVIIRLPPVGSSRFSLSLSGLMVGTCLARPNSQARTGGTGENSFSSLFS